MASVGSGMKPGLSFTVGLWLLACFGASAGDAGLGSDAGAEQPVGGSSAGGTSSVGGTAGYGGWGVCGTGGRYNGWGGEAGSTVSDSVGGSTWGMGGSGGGLPPCPVTPEVPGAALLRVPSVLPDGMLGTTVFGLSADGTTVVGGYDQLIVPGQPSQGQVHLAFRWTLERGISTLETPGTYMSDGRAANADGLVVMFVHL